MFSFFKKKPKVPGPQDEARKPSDELRSEFSRATMAKGFSLNDRINRLRSVRLEYFNALMGVTDDVADQVFPLFDRFSAASNLEIHGFCASTVAVATHVSMLPDEEKPTIIGIYLDLWVDNTVAHAPALNGQILKGSVDRLWKGYMPGIMRAVGEDEAIKLGFPNPTVVLAQELDRLTGVERNPAEQALAGATLKEAVMHAILMVRALR
ncbi:MULTISPECIES: hypothetical protein [Rhizobium]|uniref:Uncharacterized protein n=1 Tax=Rhizobium phaseoli TaxID=396 RepID=A0A7X6J4D0_9HYPH|nr:MULTISPECIES: hypothetical protein [Rhizobium]MDE8763657.1 hypothetical protein [Rhizobium sp. CBK13]NKF14855.1 hypothetical protein [Rhizobium phaseoli]QPK09197.1 hypothetical protein HER27_001025 [Rhizobium phaseoli]